MLNTLILMWAANGSSQDVVRFEIPGQRLEVAAPAIIKALGWDAPVAVAPNLRNDVILIRSVDATRTELREKIESVLNISFEERKEGILITQSGIQKQAEIKKNKENRFNALDKVLKSYQKRSAALKTFDEQAAKSLQKQIDKLSKRDQTQGNFDYRSVSKIDQEGPTERFFARLTNRLSAELFNGLSEEQPRIVFSTKPNSVQKQMPIRIDDLLSQLRQEQEIWSIYGGGRQEMRAVDEEYGGWLGRTNDKRQPFKSNDFDQCLLKVRYGMFMQIEFEAYAADGRKTFESSLYGYPQDEEEQQEKPKTEEEYKAEFEKKKVRVTGLAKEFMDSIGYYEVGRRKSNLSPELMAVLTQPETIDPLSILATPVIQATAKNRNIVAYIDDQSLAIPFLDLSQKGTRGFGWSLLPKVDDRWLTVSADDPIYSRKSRTDRKKLGQVLKFLAQNKRPLNIEEKAGYVSAKPYGERMNDIQDQLSEMVVRNPYNDWSGIDSAYRVYGKMSAANRTLSVRKEGVKFSSLSDEAKLELFRLIFYGEEWSSRLSVDYEAMQTLPQEEQNRINEGMNMIYDGMLGEPTCALPNGMLNDFQLKNKVDRKDVLFIDRPVGSRYGGNRNMSAEELGAYLFKKSNPKRYRWEVDKYNEIDENSIQIGTMRTITMNLYISPVYRYEWTMTEAFFKDEKVYTSQNLPDEIKKQIKKGFEEAEKYDKEQGAMMDQYSGPRSTVKPPPL